MTTDSPERIELVLRDAFADRVTRLPSDIGVGRVHERARRIRRARLAGGIGSLACASALTVGLMVSLGQGSSVSTPPTSAPPSPTHVHASRWMGAQRQPR